MGLYHKMWIRYHVEMKESIDLRNHRGTHKMYMHHLERISYHKRKLPTAK